MSDEEAEKLDERGRIRPWHVLLIFSIILIVHAGSGIAIVLFIGEWSERGQFGDLFGAVNALFSGLAFAGVIVTILLQREELRLQRLELRQTREELRRSAVAQEASERALRMQALAARRTVELNSVSYLLKVYEDHLQPLRNSFIPGDDRRAEYKSELELKVSVLTGRLEDLYRELTEDIDGTEEASQ